MKNLPTIAWFYWDPPRDAFTLPLVNHSIAWYGICFVLGFLLGYLVAIPLFNRTLQRLGGPVEGRNAHFLVDRLCWFSVAGTIIGARLGHVIFYDWDYYREHLLDIFKTWEGGLASHGGAIGVFIALYAYYRLYIRNTYPLFSFLELLDIICIPTALVAFFIRVGNFINQEILGTATTLPWGVLFAHPADGGIPIPRHPVQLYEGFAYLGTFILLWVIWKRSPKPGMISGLFFTLVFLSRFLLEFVKAPQHSFFLPNPFLQMGQYLSIPFILLGISLIFYSIKLSRIKV